MEHITGRCDCGALVTIGSVCCDYPIGYIDAQGLAWQDRAERDRAVGCGRLRDAYHQWNRTGGVLGHPPDFVAIMDANDVLPEHRDGVLEDWALDCSLMALSIPAVAARAALN